MLPTRTQKRGNFSEATRIELLEQDADRFDAKLDTIEGKQDRTNSLLVSVLIAVTTGAVLMALNLVVALGGNA